MVAATTSRYEVVCRLAGGGMAELFLAIQQGAEGFERRVVLKQILAPLLADPKFRNMLIDEAHVAMSLHHSNIAQVMDLGQSKGRTFLVLELVDGWDLNQIITRTRNATGSPEIQETAADSNAAPASMICCLPSAGSSQPIDGNVSAAAKTRASTH